MSFRSIVRDVRDGFGSLSRRSFEVRLPGHNRGKSRSSVHELQDQPPVIQNSRWASLPPELLRDVINRLEASESTWPGRKHVVACAAVCKSWREMCKEIVSSPEFCGKITFPVSLKQPGHRDGPIQCFIKRDKSKLTYHLFLCLSPVLLVENGKFLLSAKWTRRTTCTEYIISMNTDNISRSSSTYIGKLRSKTIILVCVCERERMMIKDKWLPLHTLAACGEFYLLDSLLKHNVDINAVDRDGLTALHRAIIGKKQAITNYLLRNSANPFVQDNEGATLMHYAVLTASTQTVKILLLYNVDINLPDNYGWTPLHLAVQAQRTDLVRLLLIKGADKTLKNEDGLTPLDLSLYNGQCARTYELIKLFKQPQRRLRHVSV